MYGLPPSCNPLSRSHSLSIVASTCTMAKGMWNSYYLALPLHPQSRPRIFKCQVMSRGPQIPEVVSPCTQEGNKILVHHRRWHCTFVIPVLRAQARCDQSEKTLKQHFDSGCWETEEEEFAGWDFGHLLKWNPIGAQHNTWRNLRTKSLNYYSASTASELHESYLHGYKGDRWGASWFRLYEGACDESYFDVKVLTTDCIRKVAQCK